MRRLHNMIYHRSDRPRPAPRARTDEAARPVVVIGAKTVVGACRARPGGTGSDE